MANTHVSPVSPERGGPSLRCAHIRSVAEQTQPHVRRSQNTPSRRKVSEGGRHFRPPCHRAGVWTHRRRSFPADSRVKGCFVCLSRLRFPLMSHYGSVLSQRSHVRSHVHWLAGFLRRLETVDGGLSSETCGGVSGKGRCRRESAIR